MPEKFTPTELKNLMALANEPAGIDLRNAFTKGEYDRRLRGLRDEMKHRGLAAVLLASPESQCWLHGYQSRWYRTGSSTEWPPLNFTTVTSTQMLLFDSEDHRQLVHLTSVVKDDDFRPVDEFGINEVHLEVVDAIGLGRRDLCGIEMWSPRQNAATTQNLCAHIATKGAATEDVSIMMRKLQLIKSDEEMTVMRDAATILDTAYDHLTEVLTRRDANMTERWAWAEFELAMAKAGGETAALHNTVARTRNFYHALSTSRVLGAGQFHADPSAVRHRYHVNAARQYFIEDATTTAPKELLRAGKVAAAAIDVINSNAHVGMEFRTLAQLLQEHYEDNGLWDGRDWLGGYQLGISFTPDWVGEFIWNVDAANEPDAYFETQDPGDRTPRQPKLIQKGLVTNFESYVGGAGLIETIAFQDNGVEVLTKGTPRELHVIGRR